jgi:hypothetical protein
MLIYKSRLSKKDKQEVLSILNNISDIYRDFFITKNNLRLFIHDNTELFFSCLNNGDKIVFGEEGIAFVTGFSDKSPRKYLKILVKQPEDAQKLVSLINWNLDIELFVKLKVNNPIVEVLKKIGFEFMAGRGKEVLLIQKGRNSNVSNNNSKN